MENVPQPITPDVEAETAVVRQLSKPQRRVLGVLVEKAFTTPEYYPLTLKAVTTGCNQKNNRNPVTNYTEEAVADALDDLRKLGLVAVVHTESGRTERYRHFMRQRYSFSEQQLAIITELMLRGRQQLGELRTRASRMVPIDSLEDLRAELQQLAEQGFVQSSGDLERRGTEVDHAFYQDNEAPRFGDEVRSAYDGPDAPESASIRQDSETRPPENNPQIASLVRECSDLRRSVLEARQEMDSLKDRVSQLSDELADLRRDLGA